MIGVRILSVPYDSGARGVRMGAGPERLLEAGLAGRLETRGHDVEVVTVEANGGTIQAETATAFTLARALSRQVREARAEGWLPLVLSGNCFASVGVVSGLEQPAGVLWFDSHGDLNTPETSASGFLDGMALSVLGGRCWQTLAASVPGFAPLPDSDLVLLGVRDLDPPEATHIRETGVRLLEPAAASEGLAAVLKHLRRRVRSLHVHLDLDVLDPLDGRANRFAAPHGLREGALVAMLSEIAREAAVSSMTLSAYEPAADEDGRALHAALASIEAFIDAWAASR